MGLGSKIAVVAAGVLAGGVLAAAPASATSTLAFHNVALYEGMYGGCASAASMWGSELYIEFTDSAAATTGDYYQVQVAQPGGTVVLTDKNSWSGSAWPETAVANEQTFGESVNQLQQGVTYSITVGRYTSTGTLEASTTEPYTYHHVVAPNALDDSSLALGATHQWSDFAGTPAKLWWAGGSWETGARYDEIVAVQNGPTFNCQTDYGRAPLLQKTNLTAPIMSFTPPTADLGKYLVISIVGHKPGEADWGWVLPAEKVVSGPWWVPMIASYGVKYGTAVPGHTVKVVGVRLSAAGAYVPNHVAVGYQWYANGRPILHATTYAYAIPLSLRGQSLVLVETFRAPGQPTHPRAVGFGTIA